MAAARSSGGSGENSTISCWAGTISTRSNARRGGARRRCARLLLELRGELGPRLSVLLGNHEISYLEICPAVLERRIPEETFYTASGFSWGKAELVASRLDAAWWGDCRLFRVVNGFLVSHAGVAADFWPGRPALAESLAALQARADGALRDMGAFDPILGAGVSRGGGQPTGGLTWLDFNGEFRDELPLPQIFGHTPSAAGARRRGRSWCLDGRQTCYGLLRRDGSLQVSRAGRG